MLLSIFRRFTSTWRGNPPEWLTEYGIASVGMSIFVIPRLNFTQLRYCVLGMFCECWLGMFCGCWNLWISIAVHGTLISLLLIPPPPRYISIMWQRLLIIPNVHQHNTKTSKSPSPPPLPSPPLPSPPLPSPSLPHPLPSPALPYPPFPSPPLPPSLPLSLPPSSDTTNSLSFPAQAKP